MKTIIIFVLAFIFSANYVQAQKAGRVDNSQHRAYYPCPDRTTGLNHQHATDLSLSPKERMKAGVTKITVCPVQIPVTSAMAGNCPQCGKKSTLSPKEQMKAEVMKRFTCPMHPNEALDKEGKCRKCTMAELERQQ
jgi:predicted RNA-binding Zn-ribbon protein involved in translation (DUF1610 family)